MCTDLWYGPRNLSFKCRPLHKGLDAFPTRIVDTAKESRITFPDDVGQNHDYADVQLSDQPIYAIKALALGPSHALVAAAGERLWLFTITLNSQANAPAHSPPASLAWHALATWQPVDPPSADVLDDTANDAAAAAGAHRSDTSGCPFHAGYLDHPEVPVAAATTTASRPARSPNKGSEFLYTLCLITLPANYSGPLGAPGHVVCVTGGQAGYLHVFNVHLTTHVRVVRAQLGGDINDVVAYPGCAHWVVVACKDRTVRVVDLHSGTTRVTLGGIGGHLGQVLCVDVHPSGKWIVSGGADDAVRLWRMPEEVLRQTDNEVRVDVCSMWTQWPHANFVDGVAFLGDGNGDGEAMTVMSKSVDGQVVVWQMQPTPPPPDEDCGGSNNDAERPTWATQRGLNADIEERGPRPTFLGLLEYPAHDLWFFKLSFAFPYLALGTGTGNMAVWHLPRTLHILRDRVRAAAASLATLPPNASSTTSANPRKRSLRKVDSLAGDDNAAYIPAVHALASVVTPTADYFDRYTQPTSSQGAGPVVWTRKPVHLAKGDLVRMCVAVPFELSHEDEHEGQDEDQGGSTRRVRFASPAKEGEGDASDLDETSSDDEDNGLGVSLLLAGVTEQGRLVMSIGCDRSPPPTAAAGE